MFCKDPTRHLWAKCSFGENLKLTCTFPYFLPTDFLNPWTFKLEGHLQRLLSKLPCNINLKAWALDVDDSCKPGPNCKIRAHNSAVNLYVVPPFMLCLPFCYPCLILFLVFSLCVVCLYDSSCGWSMLDFCYNCRQNLETIKKMINLLCLHYIMYL
jgi:hypothetical protein